MIKNIIFDFDGVILDSINIKTNAFKILFKDFPINAVNQLIDYHITNGGLSRYIKIKYFFETILKIKFTDKQILEYAYKYSELTKIELSKSKYLIKDCLNFILNNYKYYEFHIASGADEEDLKYICNQLNLTKYFLTINGSPQKKDILVKNIIMNFNYFQSETILIGDSKNDFEAAFKNGIAFYGYNNKSLKKSNNYLTSFEEFANIIKNI